MGVPQDHHLLGTPARPDSARPGCRRG
jgi:hypothetical protein